MEKIFFNLDVVDGYPPVSVESIFAEKVGDMLYKVKNFPFYINDLAFDDIISVNLIDNNFFFKELVSESGHGLVRVILFNEKFKDKLISKLKLLSLDWESIKEQVYYSVDIPNIKLFKELVCFLDESSDFLDYQEAVIPNH